MFLRQVLASGSLTSVRARLPKLKQNARNNVSLTSSELPEGLPPGLFIPAGYRSPIDAISGLC
jgi:hypothetical protein